jgi:hypothetical protein
VLLNWLLPPGAQGSITYEIRRDGQLVAIITDRTTFRDANLAPGKDYTYTIVTIDSANRRSDPAILRVSTPAFVDTVPPAITGLFASDVSSSTAVIHWLTAEPADSQVEYGTTSMLGSVSPASLTLTRSHQITLTGLSPDTTYSYRVKSRDAAAHMGISGILTFKTGARSGTVPVAPSTLLVVVLPSGQVSLAWTDNSANNEDGFKVERKISTGGAFVQIGTQARNLNFFNDSGLTASMTYCYRVRAFNAAGDSPYSNESCITTSGASAQLTIGPPSLNFGSVAIGNCETFPFAIQHIRESRPAAGTVGVTPNPPFSIVSGSSFSVSDGSAPNVSVRFCPTSVGPVTGTATVLSSATFSGANTVALSGTGAGGGQSGFDFLLVPAETALRVEAGKATSLAISVRLTGGTAQSVSMGMQGLPNGVTVEFSPNTVTPSFEGRGSFATIRTDQTTQPGTTMLTVVGSGGGIQRTVQVPLTVDPFRPPPETPSNLKAVEVSAVEVQLTWQDNSNNETGFEIQRREADGSFATLITMGTNQTSFSDFRVATGVSYSYRVRSLGPTGLSEWSNVVSVTPGATRKPDLVITTLTAPSSAGVGDFVSLNIGYRNQGTDVSRFPARIGFFLSSDTAFSSTDHLLAECGTAHLDVGKAAECPLVSGQIPNIAPGAYYLGAIVDYDNAIAETDESNNVSSAVPFTITSTGGRGTIDVKAAFNGTSLTSGPCVELTGPDDQGQVCLGAQSFPLINKTAGSWTVRYISGGPLNSILSGITPSATQTLIGGGSITFALNFTGTNLPDLVILDLNPPPGLQAVIGGQASLSGIRVQNLGPASTGRTFSVGLHWSADNIFSPTTDVFAGFCVFPALAPSQQGFVDPCVISVPSSLSPGVYNIVGVVDFDRQVDELNEENNVKVQTQFPVTLVR